MTHLETAELTHWLNYIERLHTKTIDLGLQRMQAVAQILGITQGFTCPVIMVAGTNGKGSCVHCLESIYLAAGYRVGVYTSPHLHRFNERIRINGQLIDSHLLIAAFSRVETARAHHALTFFEFTTLAALLLFQQHALDVIILEVGLGGRLDAVNVVNADVAVITGIDFDHMDWLGYDRETIGFEKAGILRQGQLAVCGDEDPPQSLLHYAQQLQVSLYCIQQDFNYQEESTGWNWSSQQQQLQHLPVPRIKKQNAASSLMVIELLASRLPVMQAAVAQGLSSVQIAGRFEYWSQPVPCIFDVAHNPQAGRWLAQQLRQLPQVKRRIAIVGMLADKDIAATLMPVSEYIDHWHAVTLSVPRGALAMDIKMVLAGGSINHCDAHASVMHALQAVLCTQFDPSCDQLLVFGSFYTVAQAQTYLLQRREG